MQEFGFYFEPGWKHILGKGALDHQLFIVALAAIYMMKDWKQVLILVSAFTIGHSVTLALSSLNIIKFNNNWVEFLVAFTIAITAISNFFQKEFTPKSIRINYFLALFFGLIHGMAFSNYIRFSIVDGQSLAWGLFGFNVGLEVGQLVVVLILLLLTQLIVSVLKINRRVWVITLSLIALGFSLKMALERFPRNKKQNDEETSATKFNDAYTYRCSNSAKYPK